MPKVNEFPVRDRGSRLAHEAAVVVTAKQRDQSAVGFSEVVFRQRLRRFIPRFFPPSANAWRISWINQAKSRGESRPESPPLARDAALKKRRVYYVAYLSLRPLF